MSVTQTYENFAQISGAVGTYPGAESALFAILSPLTDNFITLFYEFIYVVVIAVLSLQILRIDVRGMYRTFLSLIAVMTLMYPVQVSVPNISRDALKQEDPFSTLATAKLTSGGGLSFGRCGGEGCITLPAAFHIANYLSTRVMLAGMAAVDDKIVSAGNEPGSFSALSYQLINSDDQIEELARGSGVAEAMKIYRDVCSRITRASDLYVGDAKIRPLTEEELAAVGLAEGKKMPMGEVNEAARQSALRELAKFPDGFGLVLRDTPNHYPRFKIESRAYWLGAVGDSKQSATYLVAPPELRGQVTYRNGGRVVEERHPDAPEYFYPSNCADLYKTIQLGIQEFRAAAELRFVKMRAERNVSDSYDSAGIKSITALAKAVGKLQQASGGSGLGAAFSKIPLLGWVGDMSEATAVMTLAKLIQGFTEWVGKYVLLILPGAAALAVFTAALYYPIVSLFAPLPNQLGRISSMFWFVAWVKLSLLMVYVSLKLCGAASLGLAKAELASTTGAGVYALMLVTTVGAMIIAMLSPFVARALIWNDSYGLASQMGFGRGAVIGAATLAATKGAGAAARVATSGAKIAGAGLRGGGRLAARAYRSSLDGAGLGAAGRTTMKQLRDRIGQMRGK